MNDYDKSKKNKKLDILRLLQEKTYYLQQQSIKAKCDHAASLAAHNEYVRYNPQDGVGGFSESPYNVNNAEVKSREAEREYKRWCDNLTYAMESLVE